MITQDIIDEVAEILLNIESLQTSAKLSHNTFVQMHKTHDIPPDSVKAKREPIEPAQNYKKIEVIEDGLDEKGNLKNKIVYTDAPTLNSIKSNLRCSYECHAYVGPSGDGYIIIVRTKVGGVTWKKIVNHGPITHLSKDWEIENEPL